MLERVRDECGDFLKSLELSAMEMRDLPPPEVNEEGVGAAISDMLEREILPITSKSDLDHNAEKLTQRLRSASRTSTNTRTGGAKEKDDGRAPWDSRHKYGSEDTMQTLKQDNQAKQIQISKL